MLPDYPDVKNDLGAKLQDFLQKRMRIHLGALDDIRSFQYFEGDQHSITREDGDTEVSPFHRMTSEISIDKAELPKISLDEALKRLDDVAADMARQHANLVYGTISEAVNKVGNVVDAKGKGMTAALIIETLEKLHIDFDECGQPQLPQMHIHPDMEEALSKALRQLEETPHMRNQYQAVIEQKREVWRAREASRRLVG